MITRYIYKAEGLVPSVKLIRRAQVELEILLNKMSLGNLQQDKRRVYLVDGSVIEVESMFGNHQVTLTAGKKEGKIPQAVMKLGQGNDTYLLTWREGTYDRYIAYTPVTNKIAVVTAPVYHNGPVAFQSTFDLYIPYLRDFLCASSPLRGWTGYAFIVCVTSSIYMAEKDNIKYAMIVSLRTRSIVAWFMLKGWDTIGTPVDPPYISGYHVEYAGKNIIVTQQIASAQNRITTLGPDPSTGVLTVLSINNAGGYTNYDLYIKAYNPYNGIFSVVTPSWSRVISGNVEPMGAYGGPWWYGDWPSGSNDLTILTRCDGIGLNVSYVVHYTHEGSVINDDYSQVFYNASIGGSGEGAVLYSGFDYYNFPVEALITEKHSAFAGTIDGIYDAAVSRHWVGVPTVLGSSAKMVSNLRMTRNMAADLFVSDCDIEIGVENIKVFTKIGSMAAPPFVDYSVIHTNISGRSYPSASHAVGRNSSMMFTKDKNGVKVYLQSLPQLGSEIPPIEIPIEGTVDLDLTVPAKQSAIIDRPWVDITAKFRAKLIALDAALDYTAHPTKPLGLVIYSTTA